MLILSPSLHIWKHCGCRQRQQAGGCLDSLGVQLHRDSTGLGWTETLEASEDSLSCLMVSRNWIFSREKGEFGIQAHRDATTTSTV